MIAPSVVLALLSALSPGAERAVEREVVAAIAAAADTSDEAAILAVYAWHESGGRTSPPPESWDAIALVSCGAWQLRCALHGSAEHDARTWLGLVRTSGLAGVDSSPRRAAKRAREAQAALARVGGERGP